MCFESRKCVKNAFAAGAPPRTPLGQLTALPQTPWLDLGEWRREERERTRERKGKGKREGRERGKGRKGEGKVNPPSKNSGYGLESIDGRPLTTLTFHDPILLEKKSVHRQCKFVK